MNDSEIIQQYKKYEPFFGNWYLRRFIGEGAFAKVFEIVRNDFGNEYTSALKIITVSKNKNEVNAMKSEGMSERDIKDNLRQIAEDTVREIQLMYRLRGNGNIVGYEDHEVVEHEDGLGWDILIKMELLTSLGNYITKQRGQIAKRDIIKLGIDICKALETCQNYNIIHRDIKADNIFIAENGEFKLGDFGLARIIERKDIQMSKKGTSAFMAPEVYKGQNYTSAVDIYSLGIVLYRLLNNNRAPFLPPYPQPVSLDARDQALTLRMSGEKLPGPAQMPKGRLTEIVLKACAYSPEERYLDPLSMRLELEEIYHDKNGAANKELIMIYRSSEEEVNFSDSREDLTGIPGENTADEVLEEGKAERRPKRKPERRTGKAKRNRMIVFLCAAAVLALVIGIVAVVFISSVKTDNVLMAVEEIPSPEDFFLTSDIPRNEIGTITFEDSLKGMPEGDGSRLWDVSENGNNQVMAWAVMREDGSGYYDFHIAADGGVDAGKDISYFFANMVNLQSIQMNGNFHTENAENMSGLFLQCYQLSKLDMNGLDTSRTVNMSNMFNACESLSSLELSTFDTSHVTDMNSMFFSCKNMVNLNVSGFDTHRVTDMGSMFSICSRLTGVDVSGFDTSEVTNMAYMFNSCRNLSRVDVSGFNTSNVTDMHGMFAFCSSVYDLDVSSFDTANVTNMSAMFRGCISLTGIDVSGFDTSKVTNARSMFQGCNSLTDLDVSNFNSDLLETMWNRPDN